MKLEEAQKKLSERKNKKREATLKKLEARRKIDDIKLQREIANAWGSPID